MTSRKYTSVPAMFSLTVLPVTVTQERSSRSLSSSISARKPVEALDVERNAGAPRHRDDVNDGIGRAAHRHVHLDRIVEGGRGKNPLGRELLPHHVDDASAGRGAHARMAGIGRRNR